MEVHLKESGRKERAQAVTQAQMSGNNAGTKSKGNLPSGQDAVKAGFDLQNKTALEVKVLYARMKMKNEDDPERQAFFAEWNAYVKKTVKEELAAEMKDLSATQQILLLGKLDKRIDCIVSKIEKRMDIIA